MVGMPGRSGGARPGSGGARVGAGRKPKNKDFIKPVIPVFVGPKIPRGVGCWHDKPLFSNGKARLKCFVCDPKAAPSARKPYGFIGDEAECKLCKNVFVKKQYNQSYCGKKCREKFCNDAATARATDRSERPCKFCKVSFSPTVVDRRKIFCSPKCRVSWVYKEKSGNTARRRTRKYGGKYESLSKWKIFERDGWTCQICGVETPERLSGLWLPNSPELDHIIPLAKGGDHTKSNVQCACASCNRKKGASLQLLKARSKWHEVDTGPVQVVQ